MDRCKCWGKTTIMMTIEHCPSLAGRVSKECDKIVQFTFDHTNLSQFGKPNFSLSEFTIGEQNDVPSVPPEVNA